MNSQSWDVIATVSAGSDAAWFAFRMAHSLSRHRGVRVTLYLDAMDAVARQVPHVNPSLSVQAVEGFHLADHRILSASSPSNNCLIIFDSIVPRSYLLRRRHAALKSSPFALPRLGCDYMDRGDWRKSGVHVTELWGGTERGFVKPDGNALAMREEFRTRTAAAGLQRLKPPLSSNSVNGERLVTVVPDSNTDLTRWISAWSKSPWPLRVLLPRAHPSSQTFANTRHEDQHLITGQLTVSPLPSLSWRDMDELIWSSDLVISSQQDIAMRAMASGTPVVTPLTGRLRLDRSRLQHHAMGLVTLLPVNEAAERVAAIATAWSLKEREAEGWQELCDCWGDMQANAKAIARRLQQLPDLANTLLDLARDRDFERSSFGADLQCAA